MLFRSTGATGATGPTGAEGVSILSGSGLPNCDIGQIGDSYIDLSTGEVYLKELMPSPPAIRSIPSPSGSTLLVGSAQLYTTIQDAINAASNGDLLLLDAETFIITAAINVNKSLTIQGQGAASTLVTTTLSSVVNMFDISVSNVVIKNMKIVQKDRRAHV